MCKLGLDGRSFVTAIGVVAWYATVAISDHRLRVRGWVANFLQKENLAYLMSLRV